MFCSKRHLIQLKRIGWKCTKQCKSIKVSGIRESRPDRSWKCCPQISSGCDTDNETKSQLTFTCPKSTMETLEKVWNMYKSNKSTRTFFISLQTYFTYSHISYCWLHIFHISCETNNCKISLQKVNCCDVGQRLWKSRFQSFLDLSSFTWFLYSGLNILSSIAA